MTNKRVFWGGLFVLSLGALLMYLTSLANGPDLNLTFVRDVPTARPQSELAGALDNVSAWPSWFYSTHDAVIVDSSGQPLAKAKLEPGALVRLGIEPKGLKWKRFEVMVRVLAYEPGHSLRLGVVSDTKNKLTQLFDGLEWDIELRNAPSGGTIIHGAALAKSRQWRSRLFGHVAMRVLMNQVFYPDLMGLAKYGGAGTLGATSLFPDG